MVSFRPSVWCFCGTRATEPVQLIFSALQPTTEAIFKRAANGRHSYEKKRQFKLNQTRLLQIQKTFVLSWSTVLSNNRGMKFMKPTWWLEGFFTVDKRDIIHCDRELSIFCTSIIYTAEPNLQRNTVILEHLHLIKAVTNSVNVASRWESCEIDWHASRQNMNVSKNGCLSVSASTCEPCDETTNLG